MGELTGVFEDIDELFLTLICDSRPEIISTNEIIRFSFKEANNPQQTSTPITQHPNQPEAINTTPQVVEEQPSNILPKETPEDVKPQIEGEKKVKTEQEKNIF